MKVFPEDAAFQVGEVGFDTKDESGRLLDLLGRKKLGQRISTLLERIEQPLVVALNGGWGTGKSHFLKLWTGAHRLENKGTAHILYFDAFEHDYLDDPLISLVSAVLTQPTGAPWRKAGLDKLKSSALRLLKPGLRIGLAVATAGATELAGAVLNEGLKAAQAEAKDTIDDFWKKETGRVAAMNEFRDGLKELTSPEKGANKPRKIIFIVDELDRCRPDYALTLLEIIKHFFAVPNVHFVLGANLDALENSVKSRYGSGIDAAQYLQKFIHLNVGFPVRQKHDGDGVWSEYLDHLGSDMGIPRQRIDMTKEQLHLIARKHPVSLRDIQRLASRLSVLPADFERYQWGYATIVLTALILHVLSPIHYASLRAGRIQMADIDEIFSLAVAKEAGDRAGELMLHGWRRLLLDDPGEETIEMTRNAFDRLSSRNRKANIEAILADILDVFHFPEVT